MNSNTWRHVKFCFLEMLDYKDTSNAYNNYVTGTQVHKCMYYLAWKCVDCTYLKLI